MYDRRVLSFEKWTGIAYFHFSKESEHSEQLLNRQTRRQKHRLAKCVKTEATKRGLVFKH